jgi:16S rRNA (guanine527-N7)-methyltransferase
MTEATDEGALRDRLLAGLERMSLALTDDQTDRMIRYILLLERWNRAYNLTAVREPLEMVPKHLLDSLSVLPYLYGDNLLDLGTGPGLPGIPLAVAARERVFHLLDSNGTKIRFLRQAVAELGLSNAKPIHARTESYHPERKFATIVSRAVAWTPDLMAASWRLTGRPARVLVLKGQRPAATELHGFEPIADALKIHRIRVPFLEADRHLLEVQYH